MCVRVCVACTQKLLLKSSVAGGWAQPQQMKAAAGWDCSHSTSSQQRQRPEASKRWHGQGARWVDGWMGGGVVRIVEMLE